MRLFQKFPSARWQNLMQSPYMPTAKSLLVLGLFSLIVLSLLMIASSSIPYAQTKGFPELKFFWSQAIYVFVGFLAALIVYQIPLKWYFQMPLVVPAWVLLNLLLILTLLVAPEIFGAKRWLDFGPANLQTSEFVKLLMVLIVSDYVVRRSAEVRESIWAGLRLLVWYLPVLLLIAIQPDFGSCVVIVATALVILFISGVPFSHSVYLVILAIPVFAIAILISDYRSLRIFSFLDPFDDIYKSDYQLARSLMAFGRGGTTGVGYGDSILKLSHLPEAHTDFILSITGEELGFLGVMLVFSLEALIIGCIMRISYVTLKRRQLRLSYIAFGFATIIFGQVIINAGMTMALAPTKGLTLPFYSYGGSSMLMFMMMIAIILKISKESEKIYHQNKNREY